MRFIGLQLPFPQLAEAHTARNLQAIMSAEEAEHRPRHPPPLHWAAVYCVSKAILAYGAIQNGDGLMGKEMALIDALGKSSE